MMRFDVVIGNPPYQTPMYEDQKRKASIRPTYTHFVIHATQLTHRYVTMIIPSRWFMPQKNLAEFRKHMTNNQHLKRIVDYENTKQIFPQILLEGGVNYFLWDRKHNGNCTFTNVKYKNITNTYEKNLNQFETIVRDQKENEILKKILQRNETSIETILHGESTFGVQTNSNKITHQKTTNSLPIYAIQNETHIQAWIEPKHIRNHQLIHKHKVLITKSRRITLKEPYYIITPPFHTQTPSCCTQSYLFLALNTQQEAQSAETYIRTKFFRFLLSLRKTTQHAPKTAYRWIPTQTWDRTWTDQELYTKYKLTEEEIQRVENKIRKI